MMIVIGIQCVHCIMRVDDEMVAEWWKQVRWVSLVNGSHLCEERKIRSTKRIDIWVDISNSSCTSRTNLFKKRVRKMYRHWITKYRNRIQWWYGELVVVSFQKTIFNQISRKRIINVMMLLLDSIDSNCSKLPISGVHIELPEAGLDLNIPSGLVFEQHTFESLN